MKAFRLVRGFAVSFAVALCAAGSSAEELSPPKTAAEEIRETLHGVDLVDSYRWLEDQDSPQTRAWIGDRAARSPTGDGAR